MEQDEITLTLYWQRTYPSYNNRPITSVAHSSASSDASSFGRFLALFYRDVIVLFLHDTGLTDDRLLYIGDRLAMEWRHLGTLLGLTKNYMDIIEMDTKGQEDNVAFAMLKDWRDEQNGKVDQLFEALQKMERNDLAMMVVPKDKIEVVKENKDKIAVVKKNKEVAEQALEIQDAVATQRDPYMATVAQLPPIPVC